MTQHEILVAYKAGKIGIIEALEKLGGFNENLVSDPFSPSQKKTIFHSLIYKNVISPLSSVANHHDVECIERFFAEQFPLHLAIHRVNDAQEQNREYTELHSHTEQEINIIIGDKNTELEYTIQLGDEVHYVKSNTSIWIPSNLQHASNVLKGSGFFVALRLFPDSAMEERFLQNYGKA
jgi:hypothetical protein